MSELLGERQHAPKFPARATAIWEPPVRQDESRRAARGAGEDPDSGARADPPWAHAGVAVHLLPRGGAPDGRGPRHDAELGTDGADLRRRPPLQLRDVRFARAPPLLRRQRLRRDRAGPVGVGRQAAGGEPRGRRPRQRVRGTKERRRDRARGGPHLPRDDARARAAGRCSRSGTPTSTWTSCCRGSSRCSTASGRRASGSAITKARAHDSLQAFDEALPGRGRRAADRQRPAADRAGRGASSRPIDADLVRQAMDAILRAYRGTLDRDRRHLLEQYRLVHIARKVVGRRQRGHRCLDRCCCSTATPGARCSCR